MDAQCKPNRDNPRSIAYRRRWPWRERVVGDKEEGKGPNQRENRMQNYIELIPPLAEIIEKYAKITGAEDENECKSQHRTHKLEFLLRPDPPTQPKTQGKGEERLQLDSIYGRFVLGMHL